jgi:hypothetical protein
MCVKLRLLRAFFWLSISQRFLLPPGYSGLVFHRSFARVVVIQELQHFATAL